MPFNSFFLVFFFAIAGVLSNNKTHAQTIDKVKDSICAHGKQYDEPQRHAVHFPAVNVTDAYKLQEIHRALPDSLKDPHNPGHWYYTYFFETEIMDFNPANDSLFTPEADKVQYKLKDTYFFDINGDGLLDFIHYPTYYMAIMCKDFDNYVIFLQTPKGYEWVHFSGFIQDAAFSKKGILKTLNTYKGACCSNDQCTFYHYAFNKKKKQLVLNTTELIYTCQLKKKPDTK